MVAQKIQNIKIDDLVLWTENPRDLISDKANAQDILNIAMSEPHNKWELKKLVEQMGDTYDFSELPTVVFHERTPIVYDGNRRILLGKIQKKLIYHELVKNWQLPDFPDEIPCNVCEKSIALTNIYRKHGESGSWLPLERDIFLNKFMNEEKSTFLLFEEKTKLISRNSHLNKGFVKDEILTSERLKDLGFEIKGDTIKSRHSANEVDIILNDLSEKIRTKEISTRKNRGKVFDVLGPDTRKLIDTNKDKQLTEIKMGDANETKVEKTKTNSRLTKRSQNKAEILFSEVLYLNNGVVNDLYRDVKDLYQYYNENSQILSASFSALIRMSLRLLCETASKDTKHQKIDSYIDKHFDSAKTSLDANNKTTLATQNVTKANLVSLFHVGAHNYDGSKNLAQTYAIAIILGAMLKISHGKKMSTP